MQIEQFREKIIGMDAYSMFNIVRSSGSISFPNLILDTNIIKITDGESGKYILPDDDYGYIEDKERGVYCKFDMSDGSSVVIGVDEVDNSLIFDLMTSKEKMSDLHSKVVSFINYEYGIK